MAKGTKPSASSFDDPLFYGVVEGTKLEREQNLAAVSLAALKKREAEIDEKIAQADRTLALCEAIERGEMPELPETD
jgi:hypothetical protein